MIVTIVAYKRPELLRKCLESVVRADLTNVEGIFISLDYHSDEMIKEMYKALRGVDTNVDVAVNIQPQVLRYGIHNHQRYVYNRAFDIYKTSAIVALEEDAVVGNDAFEMAHWGLMQPSVKFVNLGFNTVLFCRQATSQEEFVTNVLHRDYELRSSHGWAFTKWFWRDIEPFWNGKTRSPYGWDWQVTYLCYQNNWTSLTPELSRVINTGREDGTYETPGTWDATRKSVSLCDVSRPVSYKLIAYSKPEWVPGWVTEERAL